MSVVCTVVVRWAPEGHPQILALRDELATREFDDPDRWWPGQPDVVGGRDRTAGGTWCATRIGTGATALVLNRPQKRVAEPGAPSRGVLPLLGVEHESDWTAHLDVAGMASFMVVLVTPAAVESWTFDGSQLERHQHRPGTHMFTSGGAEDGKAVRYLEEFEEHHGPAEWQALVSARPPSDDPAALVVRHERPGFVFATVFGQIIDAEPGQLRLEYSREPWILDSWRTQTLTGTSQDRV